MVSLTMLVWAVVFMLIAAAVIALLWFLIGYCESQLGGPAKIYAVIRVIFVILIILFLIGLLLSFSSGTPLFRP